MSAMLSIKPAESLEAQLLLAFARTHLNEEEAAAVRELFSAHRQSLDWGWFLDQACRHRVMPLIGHHVVQHRLDRSRNEVQGIPNGWLYIAAYESNKRRNQALFQEFGVLLDRVNESGLQYSVRKGPLICEHIYGDLGSRRMSDLDLLVRREDTHLITEVLNRFGYEQGKVTDRRGVVEPFDRRTQVYWKLHVDNLLPFVKPTDEAEIGVFRVDICTNIFDKNRRTEQDMDAFLSRTSMMSCSGTTAMALDEIDTLIDLCSHLHKEADSRYYITSGKDLTLLKFLDVAESFRRTLSEHTAEAVAARVLEHNAEQGIYFALFHARTLFPGLEVGELLELLGVKNYEFLNGYGYREGDPHNWDAGFLDRMFGNSYRGTVVGTSSIPKGV